MDTIIARTTMKKYDFYEIIRAVRHCTNYKLNESLTNILPENAWGRKSGVMTVRKAVGRKDYQQPYIMRGLCKQGLLKSRRDKLERKCRQQRRVEDGENRSIELNHLN